VFQVESFQKLLELRELYETHPNGILSSSSNGSKQINLQYIVELYTTFQFDSIQQLVDHKRTDSFKDTEVSRKKKLLFYEQLQAKNIHMNFTDTPNILSALLDQNLQSLAVDFFVIISSLPGQRKLGDLSYIRECLFLDSRAGALPLLSSLIVLCYHSCHLHLAFLINCVFVVLIASCAVVTRNIDAKSVFLLSRALVSIKNQYTDSKLIANIIRRLAPEIKNITPRINSLGSLLLSSL
jgi:hypothetical protein